MDDGLTLQLIRPAGLLGKVMSVPFFQIFLRRRSAV